MRELELGIVYTTLGGDSFTVTVRDKYATGTTFNCSDGWIRYSVGQYSGMYVGKELDTDFHRHTAWPEEVLAEPIQLDLFNVD